MTGLLDQMDVYVLPVFNIDGYVYTHTSVCYGLLKHAFFSIAKNIAMCVLLIYNVRFFLLATLEQDVEEDSFHKIWIKLLWRRPQQEL